MKYPVMAAVLALAGSSAFATPAPSAQPAAAAAATTPPALDSRIDAVTVFRGRALVIRRAETSFDRSRAGVSSRLTVGGLPDALDASSIQARCSGSSRPTLTGITLETKHGGETLDAETKAMERSLEATNDELRATNDSLSALEERRRMFLSLRDTHLRRISHHEEIVDLKEWVVAQRAIASGLEDLTRQQRKLERERRTIEARLQTTQAQMQALASKRTATRRIAHLDLRPRRAGHVVCQLRYLLPGATWTPSYDARLEDSILRVHSYGVVTNQTGEDWDDVLVSVSTAEPAMAVRMPELVPRYLRPYMPHIYGPRGGGRWHAPAPAEAKSGLAGESVREDDKTKNGGAHEQATFTQRQLFAVFTAPSRATIPSSGAPRQVGLGAHTFEPKLSYLAAPRVAQGAYLTAKTRNMSKQPLLAGEVRLFLGDDFVGRTRIATVVAGDDLALAFGRDERVKIEHERTARSQKTVGIFTKENEVREAYRIRVVNLVGRPIELMLLDQVPVSRDKRIQVTLDEPSTPLAQDPTDKPGTLRWRLSLGDSTKTEVAFGYTIRHPVHLHVAGL
jgi:uncharacterized protein (TIGR02231 family)